MPGLHQRLDQRQGGVEVTHVLGGVEEHAHRIRKSEGPKEVGLFVHSKLFSLEANDHKKQLPELNRQPRSRTITGL